MLLKPIFYFSINKDFVCLKLNKDFLLSLVHILNSNNGVGGIGFLTLQEGGLLKPPLTKIACLAPFCDPNDPKKFDFSQISMTMPPILFQGLKMA